MGSFFRVLLPLRLPLLPLQTFILPIRFEKTAFVRTNISSSYSSLSSTTIERANRVCLCVGTRKWWILSVCSYLCTEWVVMMWWACDTLSHTHTSTLNYKSFSVWRMQSIIIICFRPNDLSVAQFITINIWSTIFPSEINGTWTVAHERTYSESIFHSDSKWDWLQQTMAKREQKILFALINRVGVAGVFSRERHATVSQSTNEFSLAASSLNFRIGITNLFIMIKRLQLSLLCTQTHHTERYFRSCEFNS